MASMFLALSLLAPVNQAEVTSDEVKAMVRAVISPKEKGRPHLEIELNREADGCVVSHAYRTDERMRTFTVGWWSIDARTAEMWDNLLHKRVADARLAPIQGAVRQRIGVSREEVDASTLKPCYQRPSK